jgi:hypothetical protein
MILLRLICLSIIVSGCAARPTACPDAYCAAVGAGWIKAPPER